jgi:Flp pilus assembly protein TadG
MATLRALIRCDRGATALEFSLILPALLLFIVGSIEAAIILFIGSSIESAVLEASRYGITGTEVGMSRQDRIMAIVESRTYGLLDMDAVDMETLVYDSFEDIGKPEPLTDTNGNGSWDDGEAFIDVNGNGVWDEDMGEAGLGGGGAVVVYRLTYPWGVVTPILQQVLGGTVTHVSSIALKNEPF